MEWIYVGLVFVALAVVVWTFYTLWTLKEIVEDEPVAEPALAEPHFLFPWREPEDRTTLTWLHRLGPEDRCEIRLPRLGWGLPIVGAISCGDETLVLNEAGLAMKVHGPMPVEVVRSG